ncbi:MAG: translation initiation factor IF-2, partial [Oscillospiraceae bacterium]|nr:translation initiation factor IF-2 [Oscillospiraceae bacterium]
EKISNDEVRVRVIHAAVGAINESDILLASTANAIIVGFNVRPDAAAAASAQRSKVDMRMYRVIYDAIEEIETAMKGMLAPKFREAILGHAEVRMTYKVSAIGTIAGCYVRDGKVTRDAQVRVLRDNIVIYEGNVGSLQRFKDSVKEVASNYECGMSIEKFNDIKEGDIFECFVMEEIPR